MILIISFLILSGIFIFFEYKNAKIRKQKEFAFNKWQIQVLSTLEKILNK